VSVIESSSSHPGMISVSATSDSVIVSSLVRATSRKISSESRTIRSLYHRTRQVGFSVSVTLTELFLNKCNVLGRATSEKRSCRRESRWTTSETLSSERIIGSRWQQTRPSKPVPSKLHLQVMPQILLVELVVQRDRVGCTPARSQHLH